MTTEQKSVINKTKYKFKEYDYFVVYDDETINYLHSLNTKVPTATEASDFFNGVAFETPPKVFVGKKYKTEITEEFYEDYKKNFAPFFKNLFKFYHTTGITPVTLVESENGLKNPEIVPLNMGKLFCIYNGKSKQRKYFWKWNERMFLDFQVKKKRKTVANNNFTAHTFGDNEFTRDGFFYDDSIIFYKPNPPKPERVDNIMAYINNSANLNFKETTRLDIQLKTPFSSPWIAMLSDFLRLKRIKNAKIITAEMKTDIGYVLENKIPYEHADDFLRMYRAEKEADQIESSKEINSIMQSAGEQKYKEYHNGKPIDSITAKEYNIEDLVGFHNDTSGHTVNNPDITNEHKDLEAKYLEKTEALGENKSNYTYDDLSYGMRNAKSDSLGLFNKPGKFRGPNNLSYVFLPSTSNVKFEPRYNESSFEEELRQFEVDVTKLYPLPDYTDTSRNKTVESSRMEKIKTIKKLLPILQTIEDFASEIFEYSRFNDDNLEDIYNSSYSDYLSSLENDHGFDGDDFESESDFEVLLDKETLKQEMLLNIEFTPSIDIDPEEVIKLVGAGFFTVEEGKILVRSKYKSAGYQFDEISGKSGDSKSKSNDQEKQKNKTENDETEEKNNGTTKNDTSKNENNDKD